MTSTSNEATPLVAPLNNSSRRYYFLNKQDDTYRGGSTDAVKDSDGVIVVEDTPRGSSEGEFAPRIVVHKQMSSLRRSVTEGKEAKTFDSKPTLSNAKSSGWFSWLNGGGNHNQKSNGASNAGGIGTILKQRKAPIKIEPKVFFSNERTFLAWLHVSIVLAGASIAIVSLSENDSNNPYGELYGILMLPVAIAFIVYSMYQYASRARMIRNRLPGPYEDTVGPTVLGIFLMLSIVGQFGLKLYQMSQGY